MIKRSISCKHSDIIQIAVVDNNSPRMVRHFLNHPMTNPDMKLSDGKTALMHAANRGYTECLIELLQHADISVNATMKMGVNALFLQ